MEQKPANILVTEASSVIRPHCGAAGGVLPGDLALTGGPANLSVLLQLLKSHFCKKSASFLNGMKHKCFTGNASYQPLSAIIQPCFFVGHTV